MSENYFDLKNGQCLKNNKLQRKESSTSLNEIEKLSMSRNEITQIDAFESFSSLRELWLGYNKLERIGVATFKGLTNLEKLSLSMNKITRIEANAFESLLNLRELWLGYNKLERIDAATFKGLANLEKLSLSFNELTEIDPKFALSS